MKKTTQTLFVVLLLSTLIFTSCKSEKELTVETSLENRDMIVQSKLEKSIKAKLQFPDSYEFVELKLRDSVLYSDNIKYYKDYYQRMLESDKKNLERQESYKTQGSSRYEQEKVTELQSTIAKNEKILLEIDKIATALGEDANETASYTYNYMFKSKSVNGEDQSYNYIVQTGESPEYKVIKLAMKEEMVILSPNNFPGYLEMLKTFE